MILSPWVFLPLHLLHTYPLSMSLKPLNNAKLAFAISVVFNFCLYLVENWTMTFPGLSRFWYEYGLSNLGLIQIIAFLYYSVQTARNNGQEKGRSCSNNTQLIQYWICATIAVFTTSYVMDWGVPASNMEDQVLATTDGFHSIAHFWNHIFLFVMVWHVASLSLANGSNNTLLGGVSAWASSLRRVTPITLSFTTCIIVAFGAITISMVEKGDIPILSVSWNWRGTISFPCQTIFNQDTMEYFGSALEQSHFLSFLISFAIGTISLGTTLSWPYDFRRKSLVAICTFLILACQYCLWTSSLIKREDEYIVLPQRRMWSISSVLYCH